MAAFVHDTAFAVTAGLNLLVTAIIVLGVAGASARLVVGAVKREVSSDLLVTTRQRLARWLSLALEVAVATDILLLAVAPTWSELGMLAAIVALRLALNTSLERELAAAGSSPAAPTLSS